MSKKIVDTIVNAGIDGADAIKLYKATKDAVEETGAKRPPVGAREGRTDMPLGGAVTTKTPRQKLDLLAEQADDLPEPARTMFLEVILEGQGHIQAGGNPDDVMRRILEFADSADMGIG